MRRLIDVGNGREVAFAASGATPRAYRKETGRDIFADFQIVAAEVSAALDGGAMSPDALTAFEDMAWIMAREAEPRGVPDTADKWLEGLPSLPVRVVFPALELLWLDNLTQTATPAKK